VGQELKPDIFESICIPGQRLSEEDLRKLRSMIKKKRKKGSAGAGNRGHKRAKTGETMKKRDRVKKAAKTVSKKKPRASEVPSDEEIRELESFQIPEKIKKEVCQEVAKQMGISVEEVREIMEKLESGIPSRKLNK
jgi:intergrase/recombinase